MASAGATMRVTKRGIRNRMMSSPSSLPAQAGDPVTTALSFVCDDRVPRFSTRAFTPVFDGLLGHDERGGGALRVKPITPRVRETPGRALRALRRSRRAR